MQVILTEEEYNALKSGHGSHAAKDLARIKADVQPALTNLGKHLVEFAGRSNFDMGFSRCDETVRAVSRIFTQFKAESGLDKIL